ASVREGLHQLGFCRCEECAIGGIKNISVVRIESQTCQSGFTAPAKLLTDVKIKLRRAGNVNALGVSIWVKPQHLVAHASVPHCIVIEGRQNAATGQVVETSNASKCRDSQIA